MWEPEPVRDTKFDEHLERLKRLAQWPSLAIEKDREAIRGVLNEFLFILSERERRMEIQDIRWPLVAGK